MKKNKTEFLKIICILFIMLLTMSLYIILIVFTGQVHIYICIQPYYNHTKEILVLLVAEEGHRRNISLIVNVHNTASNE